MTRGRTQGGAAGGAGTGEEARGGVDDGGPLLAVLEVSLADAKHLAGEGGACWSREGRVICALFEVQALGRPRKCRAPGGGSKIEMGRGGAGEAQEGEGQGGGQGYGPAVRQCDPRQPLPLARAAARQKSSRCTKRARSRDRCPPPP